MENADNCTSQVCPCRETCPLKSALERIGGKWKLRIMCALVQDGTTRYGEMKRKIDGITNTMLSSSLRELERDGLVIRTQFPTVPVRVEYTATEDCRSLMPILMQLIEWESRVLKSGEKS